MFRHSAFWRSNWGFLFYVKMWGHCTWRSDDFAQEICLGSHLYYWRKMGKITRSGLNTRSSTIKTAHSSRSCGKFPRQRACHVWRELHLIELDDKGKKMLWGSSDLAALPDDVTGSVGTCWRLETDLAFFLASPLSTGDDALPRSQSAGSTGCTWMKTIVSCHKKKNVAGSQEGVFLKGWCCSWARNYKKQTVIWVLLKHRVFRPLRWTSILGSSRETAWLWKGLLPLGRAFVCCPRLTTSWSLCGNPCEGSLSGGLEVWRFYYSLVAAPVHVRQGSDAISCPVFWAKRSRCFCKQPFWELNIALWKNSSGNGLLSPL